jgi:molybdopterin molybdotransferase
MLTIEAARAILNERATPLTGEPVALRDALGRCLAGSIVADRDFPPTDRSAMDGFAVRAADAAEPGAVLRVDGEMRAGQDPRGIAVSTGAAVRIMTGAVVPDGADAVVMVELTEGAGADTVRILEAVRTGQHIRRRAEDLGAGRTVLEVVTRPRVAVLSTGDEIVEPSASPAPHEVRNSNARTLLAQLAGLGIEGRDLGIARDHPEGLRSTIERGLDGDLLLLTGGVSMGRYDLVGEQLAALGASTLFHKVAVKPGKPILAAERGSCLIVGLPGNPVSAFTGFEVFVAPVLRRRMGWASWDHAWARARLTSPLRRKPGRTTFQLARIEIRDDGLTVAPIRTMGSGDVLSLVRANGFVLAEPGNHTVPEGEPVTVLRWPGWSGG